MKESLATIIIALNLFGCSSSTTNESVGGASTGGQAGSDTGGAAGTGGQAGAETGGTAGIVTGGMGGTSTGGVAGLAGGGGTPSGGGGTAGGGGTGGACIPKTCATFSYQKTGKTNLACGVIDDGCGNVVDCGGCKDPMNDCGASNNPITQTPPGTPNICDGKCISQLNNTSTCPGTNHHKLSCTVNYPTIDPGQNGVPGSGDWYNCSWHMTYWCCYM